MKKKIMISIDEWIYKHLKENHISVSGKVNDLLRKEIISDDDGTATEKRTKR